MTIKQYLNTIERIRKFHDSNKCLLVGRHLFWQIRKLFKFYPTEYLVSKSRIYDLKKGCGASALLYIFGEYDYNNMNLIKLLLINKKVFFDVGANIGIYTLIASEIQSAKVFAFEPHPGTYKFLKINVNKNRRKNIKTFKVALGLENRLVSMTDYNDDSINKIVASDSGSVIAHMIRGDEFCKRQKVTPDIIKIDTEGSELQVLYGFGENLKNASVVFIEINQNNSDINKRIIIKHMLTNNFIGPYKFDFEKRILLRYSKSFEDDVFISKKALPKFNELGIKFQ